MRKYTKDDRLEQVRCNKCGKDLLVKNGMLKEDVFEGKKVFGYFSAKDGMIGQFDLCEACYEAFTAGFVIPVKESERLELL